ncbi:MAG: hypothetical protein ACXWNK_06785 [Vulcanimicrobiaceae bacterium]
MKALRALLPLTLGIAAAVTAPASAMPPFAQAYGVKCSVCHTQVPALNSYGRYVQRTGYASLDPQVLRRAFPLWFGEQVNYDSQGDTTQSQYGNAALHAVGPIANDWTYHAQQWIYQDNKPGDLDTFWLAYNNLFHRDGHLFVGEIESPGPSPYSQWSDLAGFAPPEITVGEHVYQLDGNRWGAKFNYVRKSLDVEAGWLGSGNGWAGFSDFGPDTDKTLLYKVAFANPTTPVDFGVVGSRGSWPLSDGNFDQYWSISGYVQTDPLRHYVPGSLFLYQHAFDGNPGGGSPAALSKAYTAELYEPFFANRALLSIRKEWTDDGLGNATQTGVIDFSYQIAKYLRVYVENALAQNSKPGWKYTVWWTTPFTNRVH